MADSLCRVIKNSLTEVLYFVLPQIHAASNKACKGHRQNVFLCLQNFLLWALNKKNKRQKVLMWRLREHKYLQACKKSQSMTCWALTHCWAKLHITHMHEKTLPGVLWANQMHIKLLRLQWLGSGLSLSPFVCTAQHVLLSAVESL